MDMSRIHLNIDRLVLNGFQPLEAKALSEALKSRLSEVLADRSARTEWARSHRTPMLKLGNMPMEAGTAAWRTFGRRLAGAVGKGLKP